MTQKKKKLKLLCKLFYDSMKCTMLNKHSVFLFKKNMYKQFRKYINVYKSL